MNDGQFQKVLDLVRQLQDAGIYHEMSCYREEAISIVVRVPGQYWEIDFLADGSIGVERFVSNGEIDDESVLEEMIAQFSDEEPGASNDILPG